MNKRIILSAMAIIGFVMVSLAQTIVSTEVENRNVVLEQFTGMFSGACVNANISAQAIMNAHPNDVSIITIHEGIFAEPQSMYHPDYRTEWGAAFATQAGADYVPSGTVNRHMFSGDTMLVEVDNWEPYTNQILGQTSYVNVAAIATIVKASRQLQVEVEVYYTSDSPEDINYLNVALLQDSIVGYQNYGGIDYNHMHMLRDMLTGQWGIPIQNTSANSVYTTILRYDIPESIRDIEMVLDHLKIVAFVAEGHTEIISGNNAEMIVLDNVDLDAAVMAYKNLSQSYCGGPISPIITVHNYGTETLTNFDIEYTVNEETPVTYAWTGNLVHNASNDIVLPGFPMQQDILQSNTIKVTLKNPNGSIDKVLGNNVLTQDLGNCVDAMENCKLGFFIPNGAEEVTWELIASNGDVLLSDGPYDANTVYQYSFSFPGSDIYTLKIHDTGGDAFGGSGFIKFFNMSKGGVVWEADMEAWGSELVAEFRYNPEGIEDITVLEGLNLYPNPASETATLTYTLLKTSKVSIELYDMLGKYISSCSATKEAGFHQYTIDVTGLRAGLYLVNLNIDGNKISKKINVIQHIICILLRYNVIIRR